MNDLLALAFLSQPLKIRLSASPTITSGPVPDHDKLYCPLYLQGNIVNLDPCTAEKCYFCSNESRYVARSDHKFPGYNPPGSDYFRYLCLSCKQSKIGEYSKPVVIPAAPVEFKPWKYRCHLVLAIFIGAIVTTIVTHPAMKNEKYVPRTTPPPTDLQPVYYKPVVPQTENVYRKIGRKQAEFDASLKAKE